ncbi:MAG TPA: formylmethanofuran dehydrogenase subunit C [Lacipirellula sp.]
MNRLNAFTLFSPMPLRLAIHAADRIPIDFTGITPGALRERSLDEVRKTKVRRGNRETELGELFEVTGSPADMQWRLEGDFSAVHGIGARMTAGEIVVDGHAGRHAGAQMRGGRLDVHGDAGDQLGAEMHAGLIRVHGNAGDRVAAAYAGSRRGMTGGTILIDGDAGSELGQRMRRGLIAVTGAAGDYLGMRMCAGSIFLFGDCGRHPGFAMRRGTIGLFGNRQPTLLPTFRAGYQGPLPALHLIEKHLHALQFNPPRLRQLAGMVELYHGDLLELGRGEILLPIQ